MRSETRERLAELILEELAAKIKRDKILKYKLESFTDLPVDKVAEAILRQFDYLLSSELRELIQHLVRQEVSKQQITETPESKSIEKSEVTSTFDDAAISQVEEVLEEDDIAQMVKQVGGVIEDRNSVGSSVLEHFENKEPITTEPFEIELKPNDWLYMYGMSYAPNSKGRGYPSKRLTLIGIENYDTIFLLDYGDLRLYLSRLSINNYTIDKHGRPIPYPQQKKLIDLEHEKVLNLIRSEDLLVSVPSWTIIQGRDNLISKVEDHYVKLLRVLIEMQDAIDWDVEVFAFDELFVKIAAVDANKYKRTMERETRHPALKKKNQKEIEKVLFQEKQIAQEIHSQLLTLASRAKIFHMIRLDNAFQDDWKPILHTRYVIGKAQRKSFCQEVTRLQKLYEEFQLIFKISNPTVQFPVPSFLAKN